MTKYKLLLVLTLLSSFSQTTNAQTKWKRVEAFKFDWDGREGVQVVLEIPSSWSDPGDFTRIRIRVPGHKEFALLNETGWVRYGSDEASKSQELRNTRNGAPSKHVLAVKADKSRTLLFLFGYSYASSPGSLDVLEISHAGQPSVVLHRDELGLKDVRDLDGDGVADLVGYPCLSQQFGEGLLTYDPFNVFKLGAASANTAKFSLTLSRTYNLKHYYGWAGAQCSEKIAVVLHPPKGGKPLVMSIEDAEKLMSKKR